MKVLVHNEWDILSLGCTLYTVNRSAIEEQMSENRPVTHTNIGKWFADLKSHDRSKQIFESVIAEYGINHPATHFHFGFILKKEQAYEDAVSSFTDSGNRSYRT